MKMAEETLLSTRSLYWLEVMSLTGRLSAARNVLMELSQFEKLNTGAQMPTLGFGKSITCSQVTVASY